MRGEIVEKVVKTLYCKAIVEIGGSLASGVTYPQICTRTCCSIASTP